MLFQASCLRKASPWAKASSTPFANSTFWQVSAQIAGYMADLSKTTCSNEAIKPAMSRLLAYTLQGVPCPPESRRSGTVCPIANATSQAKPFFPVLRWETSPWAAPSPGPTFTTHKLGKARLQCSSSTSLGCGLSLSTDDRNAPSAALAQDPPLCIRAILRWTIVSTIMRVIDRQD